jgi:hypothetical protein
VEKSSRPAQLESTIREITKELLAMTVTPHVRELRAKALTYGRVVASWSTYAPSAPQIDAMLECVAELEEKVLEAKRERESSRDLSKAARANGDAHEPSRVTKKPLASGLPPSMEWNASVPEASGVRNRHGSNPVPARPSLSSNDLPTRPPPPMSGSPAAPTIPPLSSPRTIDEHPTPIPALLRSRRSR